MKNRTEVGVINNLARTNSYFYYASLEINSIWDEVFGESECPKYFDLKYESLQARLFCISEILNAGMKMFDEVILTK